MPEPVVIVGGGLAGLACATALQARGVEYRLFEASDRVGGRVRTDEIDGFRMDRGFQVIFSAYPHAELVLKDAPLDLRAWRNGARVWDGARLRTLDRDLPLTTVAQRAISLPDLARLGLLSLDALRLSGSEIGRLPDRTTEEEFRRRGFSEEALRRFLRPFYGGVFVDATLGTSRRQFTFVHKMLCLASAAIPNLGMEVIPRAMRAKLDASRLTLGTPVEELLRTPDGRVDGLRVAGERISASRVVLATDADVAARLSGLPLERPWLGSTVVYFESERAVAPGAYIVLNGTGRGRINEVVPVSNCAPGRAPAGRHLTSAVVLGIPEEPDEAFVPTIQDEFKAMFPKVGDLRPLRTYRIPKHQLAQPPGFDAPLPAAPEGLVLAGERTSNCSIDGAILSGLRAAEKVAP